MDGLAKDENKIRTWFWWTRFEGVLVLTEDRGGW